MSAWVTSKAHIDAMIAWALQEKGDFSNEPHFEVYMPMNPGVPASRVQMSEANATMVGQVLTETIVQGVNHRYPSDGLGDLPGARPAWWLQSYVFEPVTAKITDGDMVSLCRCYAYQASEHDAWEKTPGHGFVEACQARILSHVQDAEKAARGRDLPWGYEEEHVRPTQGAAKLDSATLGELRSILGDA